MTDLSNMDWVRAAICNGIVEGMDILDLWACAENAETPQAFDTAVNELAAMMPEGEK